MEHSHLLMHEWRLTELREEARRAELARQASRNPRRQVAAAAPARRRPRWLPGRFAVGAGPCA